jgi:hypothetical protein
MPDQTCPHLSPIGGWCRLKSNFKCPASTGRVGCPFPRIPDLNRRASERLEQVDIPMSAVMNSNPAASSQPQMTKRAQAFELLMKPFAPTEVEWRVVSLSRDQRRAFLKPSVNLRSVIDRLDHAVGASGWSERYFTLANGTVSCRLTVLGVAREAVSTTTEVTGEARAEALRAAALKFGVARGLENVAGVWVDWDEETERPLETPVLPAWAVAQPLPEPARQLEPLPTPLLPRPAPSEALSEQRQQDKLIQQMIRAVRELPGGEGALRRILRRHNRADVQQDKRSLYAELRRTYRELSGMTLEAA